MVLKGSRFVWRPEMGIEGFGGMGGYGRPQMGVNGLG